MMAVEIMIARQLTYHAAREKDSGLRCDLEAGMAKLYGARVAWANADNAVQVHGGNGFALEFPVPRILCLTPASSISLRAPPRFRLKSLRADCCYTTIYLPARVKPHSEPEWWFAAFDPKQTAPRAAVLGRRTGQVKEVFYVRFINS